MFQFTPRPQFEILRDAATSGGTNEFGDLPEWNLDDLYKGEEASELTRDMAWLENACADFAKTYEGNLAGLNADAMLECILAYEKIDSTAGRIMSFAGLRYYQNTTDADRAKFMSDCQENITVFTTPLVFFSLTIALITFMIFKVKNFIVSLSFFYSSSFPFSLLPSSITFIGKLCIELLTVRTFFFRFG